MKRYNRQDRYRRFEHVGQSIINEIQRQVGGRPADIPGIINSTNRWLGEIESLLGQERSNRATSTVLPPTSDFPTRDEIWQFVKAVRDELRQIKQEEDRQTLTDLARRGEGLERGHHDVNEWLDGFNEWQEEVEDRLRNEDGDEDAAAQWVSLKIPEVFGNPPTEQRDREQLFEAISRRLQWLRNRIRQGTLRAIPPPPHFHFKEIEPALWVLECEQSHRQGTAFALPGVGLVTCRHVLGPQTRAFQPETPAQKFPVTVAKESAATDSAILKIDCPLR